MNSANDLFLDSFLDMQPSVKNQTAHVIQHPLRRALLTSVGESATTICQRALELAAEWLGVEPPVAHWAPGESDDVAAGADGQDATLVAALDKIALRKVADDLRMAGYDLQSAEELTIWIVVAYDGQELPAAATVITIADTLRRLTWNRMRAQASIKLMVLVEPADTDALAAWQRAITACASSVYFCSPINLRHLRLAPNDYAEQIAVALTTFLCGNFPSHAQPANSANLAVGAAAWTAPAAAVRRGLALHSAIQVIDRVQAQLDRDAQKEDRENVQNGLPSHLPSLDQCDVDLATTVPQPMSAVRWRDLGIIWEDIDVLHSLIPARLERREKRLEQAVREHRMAWLDQRMNDWTQLLVELDRLQLPTGDDTPPLRLYALALSALREQFVLDRDTLAAAFERSEQRTQEADEQVDSAWERVEKLCGQLPRMTARGIVYAALQPWMWPIWPYAFRAILPQEGQRLLDSIAHRSKVRWYEANWHILRQMMLVMNQDVNQRLRALDQLGAYIGELRAYLTAELAALLLPAPWTHATLHTLWQTSRPNIPALATFPESERPLNWPSATTKQCGERLIAHFMSAAEFVERWSVLDFLAQPFADNDSGDATGLVEARGDGSSTAELVLPSACVSWLTDLAETALPLWPDPAVTPVSGTEGWCMLPQPAPGVANGSYGPDAIRHWCEDIVNLSPATLTGRTLAILRWAPVDAMAVQAEIARVTEEVAL